MTVVEFVAVLMIVLLLIISSFIAGLKLAGYYHQCASADREYALQKQYVRIRAGADADDPVAPYVARNKIQLPPEFAKRMQQNGRATVSFNSGSKQYPSPNNTVETG